MSSVMVIFLFCLRTISVSSGFIFVWLTIFCWLSFVVIIRLVLISICWITAAVLSFVSFMNSALILDGESWWCSVVVIVSPVVTTVVIKIIVARFPVVGIVSVD